MPSIHRVHTPEKKSFAVFLPEGEELYVPWHPSFHSFPESTASVVLYLL